MKIIDCWKASDGRIFESEKECITYETDLEVKNKLMELANRVFYYGMTADDLGRELYENRDVIKSISRFM